MWKRIPTEDLANMQISIRMTSKQCHCNKGERFGEILERTGMDELIYDEKRKKKINSLT
jgi:hypothetical protein